MFVRAKDSDRFSRLHQKRFVIIEPAQRRDDRVIACPVSCGFAATAVDHQVSRALCHFGVEIVHEHAQRRFLLPAFAGERRAARSTDDPAARRCHCRGVGHRGHLITQCPRRTGTLACPVCGKRRTGNSACSAGGARTWWSVWCPACGRAGVSSLPRPPFVDQKSHLSGYLTHQDSASKFQYRTGRFGSDMVCQSCCLTCWVDMPCRCAKL